MRILRIAIVPALVSVLIGVLTGCGHRGSMHALPPTAGAGNGNVLGAVRKPRTINEAAYPNAVIADTPLAFYRLNDAGSTMSDSGANGLNGSYGTSVGHNAGSLVPNTIDPAAAFPGGAWSANAIGTVAHSTTLQPANIALEAWVSEKSVNSGGYVDLVSYGPQSAGQAYSLQLSPTNTISGFVAVTNSPGYSQFTGSTVLTPGTAYHVVLAYDGTAPKLYVNGKLETGTADGATSGGALGYGGVGTT
ncbi:MAG: Concanavalin A-like lectin/glucanase superfamily, partial [Candidatus Eremiobacteraeota bacterium]|nr:Concanavalin A-like lectin/glucanase superfamily [Candidatus Eremiobacteraeota bacterium]